MKVRRERKRACLPYINHRNCTMDYNVMWTASGVASINGNSSSQGKGYVRVHRSAVISNGHAGDNGLLVNAKHGKAKIQLASFRQQWGCGRGSTPSDADPRVTCNMVLSITC